MDQLQNQLIQSLPPIKTPILVTVISVFNIIICILGILSYIISLPFINSNALFKEGTKEGTVLFLGNLIVASVPVVLYGIQICIAIGLWRLGRWALYLYLVGTLLSVVYKIIEFLHQSDVFILISIGLSIFAFVYLLSIQSKFVTRY